ncbi:HNH endonuclease [Labrys sp. La1]|uniref:HNH endonuclease n=1 Tax=Labrys sp. La1 TaxID=3404917 RepID=UPI003EC14C67
MTDLTPDDVRSVLQYDPDTGVFFSLKTKKNIGATDGIGYQRFKIGGKLYRLHRLAWVIIYGEWPAGDVDHINGNTFDNRICNLRVATRALNIANSKLSKKNTSGYKGVSYSKSRNKWQSYITVARKHIFLGNYDCPTKAHAAYFEAAKRYFGEFARAS